MVFGVCVELPDDQFTSYDLCTVEVKVNNWL